MSILSDIANEEQKMDLTPMIDVVFLLLIFFMCTIKFKTLEGKLSAYLPKDVGSNVSDAEPKEKIEVKLTVVAEGTKLGPKGDRPYDPAIDKRFTYGDDRQISFSVNSKTYQRIDEVRDRLVYLREVTPENPVQIDARAGIVYGDVALVLDAILQAKFEQVSFAGSYEK